MKPHSIEIVILENGEISSEVKGISGKSCSEVSKWLNDLGEVKEELHTQDWYKPEQSIRGTGKIF